MKALRRALASFTHSEFLTVRSERDQAQHAALALERTVADQALEIVTLQARLARLTSSRDADGRFMKRNPTQTWNANDYCR